MGSVPQVRVFFTGASGTGKSAMYDAIRRNTGLEGVPSPTRAALAELKRRYAPKLDDCDKDGFPIFEGKLEQELQDLICGGSAQSLADAARAGPLIAERSICMFAYTTYLLGGLTERNWIFNYLRVVEIMKGLFDLPRLPQVVFFFRPVEEIWLEALTDPNNHRAKFLEPIVVNRIDGIIHGMLTAHNIPFVEVTGSHFPSRYATVWNAIVEASGWTGE